MSQVVDRPRVRDSDVDVDGVFQVVLYNDNVNSFDHVIVSLITVFGHPAAIAEKIAMEAHQKGRSVAEVEDFEKAMLHKLMLVNAKLTAEVEKI